MKLSLLTLGITASFIASGVTSIAVAASEGHTTAVTQWDIAQENLVREFSQGLGVDLQVAPPALAAAKADSAAAGSSANRRANDHYGRDHARSHDPSIKKTKHSN